MIFNIGRDYRKMTLVLIIISTLMRLIIASSLELSTAEVYYWAYSLKLQLNYFDHPPIVAWLIRLTTANLLLHSEIFVRLGAIAAAAGSTWLIFKVGTAVYNHQTGWFAALLYTSSLYGSFIAGAIILPDSPLFRETLAHWSGPAYSCLLILPAIKLASGMQMQKLKIPVILKFGLVYLITIAVSEILITNFYPGTLSDEKNGLNVGRDDLTLDMYGWKEAGEKFDSLYRND